MLGGVENYLNIRERLLELYATTYKSIKIYFRYPMWIVSDILTTPLWILVLFIPVLLFLPPGQWSNPTYIQYFYWGMVYWTIISSALWSFGMSIRREQQMGTIELLFLSNSSRLTLFVGRLATRFISLVTDLLVMALTIYLFFNTTVVIIDPLLLIFYLTLSIFLSLGFGMIYGGIVLKLKNPNALNNILQFIIMGLGGIFIPVQMLPEPLKKIALAFPFSYSVDLVRYAAMGTSTILPLYEEILIVILSTIVFNIIGIKILRKIEMNSKKTGKLGTY